MRSCILKNLLRTRRVLLESYGKNHETLTYSQLKLTRRFSSDLKIKCDHENDNTRKDDDHNLAAAINTRYKFFDDKDADVILDVSEEQEKIALEDLNAQEEVRDPYVDLNLKHGTTGVYDIEDLVTLLDRDKAKNIFVASVPKIYSYVDYIVVVTGKSQKHMKALATFVRKVYKLKRYKTDLIPKIEGENATDWIAIDLGNIVLHIFSDGARREYDLETLWTVGSQYDDKTKGTTEDVNLMDQYNAFLANLQPADNTQ
ncbi:hypothetical protein DMN91_006678 [Ooceraea biroi]|uniref:Mitochondrial assembly of ribosomal large subunit protein 1 n=1 Tax=Ooceraea biroi TaxID=2015173 RepID=A0A3L8DIP1_OOCBI|nr:protein Iojap-related, mitochondrial [Ooceraea biroi]RLU20072.1 hypothetical protein DMN91_006678 [Ooceraea biroi]